MIVRKKLANSLQVFTSVCRGFISILKNLHKIEFVLFRVFHGRRMALLPSIKLTPYPKNDSNSVGFSDLFVRIK